MELVSNWKLVLEKAYSMKLTGLTMLISVIAISLPLWDPEASWFSSGNLIAIGTFFSSLGAGILRLVDQGLASGEAVDAD